MSATVQPSAVARGWAERRGLPPRRVRRNHAGRLAPHFANVRPAKFVFSSGGGMGLREGAPEETHRDSHQPPLPSAVYNPNQGKTKGDDEMPELFNNVVHERGGRIRARGAEAQRGGRGDRGAVGEHAPVLQQISIFAEAFPLGAAASPPRRISCQITKYKYIY